MNESLVMEILIASFYARSTLTVARDLVGAVLVTEHTGERTAGRIVEVEAYLGQDDPASHAARGPTARSAIMFGSPGTAYVYFIYGMYHCLNAVTEPNGKAGAVLIRALEPVAGEELMMRRRYGRQPESGERFGNLTNGPGKLCQALGIDLTWNGLSLTGEEYHGRRVWIAPPVDPPSRLVTTPRIGVRRAAVRHYRYLDAGSACLSSPVTAAGRPV